jgi:hypothetical protein
MNEYFQQYFDQISIPLAICFLGILFIINGVYTIKTKKAIVVSRDARLRWKKPGILTENDAIKSGKYRVIFGIVLLAMGLCPIIGTLL